MIQIATVKRLIGENRVEVLVRRQSACNHDCDGCGPKLSASVTAVAENLLGARPSDTVQVESECGQVLGAAFVLYFVPLLLLFVGYFIASGLIELGEGISLSVGMAGFAVGIAINLLVDRHLRNDKSIRFRITEVLKSCSDM